MIAAELARWQHLRETAQPHLSGLESMGFRHMSLRIEVELAWHDEFPKVFGQAGSMP